MVELEKIQKFFEADRFAYQNGIRIQSVREGEAVCTMPIEDRHLNAGNAVQGGATFTLADFAFAVASNCSGELVVSVNNNISFIRAPKGSSLIATARERSTGGRLCFYDVEVRDDQGILVATMAVTGYRKGKLPL